MPRPQARRRSRSKGPWAAIGGIALICATMAGFAGLAVWYLSAPRKPTLDRVSLCPTTGPEGVHIVLVDTTDDLSETTKREVLQLLDDQIMSLPAYYKLDIRVLDIPANRSRSLFSKCNPGDGTGLSEWTDNPRIARLRWIESFRMPAKEAMSGSFKPERADNTPLMGAIQDIAIDQFSSAAVRSKPKALMIISDMLEHTSDYSQYPKAGSLSYDRYKGSLAYRKYSTDLHRTAVAVGYVQRPRIKLDTAHHVEFWREWIVDNRGTFAGAKRLQGAD